MACKRTKLLGFSGNEFDGQDIKIPIFAEAETVTAVLDTDAGANVNWNEANVY